MRIWRLSFPSLNWGRSPFTRSSNARADHPLRRLTKTSPAPYKATVCMRFRIDLTGVFK
jgi:hypothetical protein